MSQRVFSPENGRHSINITDSTEKNGSSHDSTDNIHRPSESIPGCLIATEIDTAIAKLDNGTDVIGLKIRNGTFGRPTISNSKPAVTSKPQNTAITIAA